MVRTYTEAAKNKGYLKENIDNAIKRTNWEPFRTDNLPFCQGACINIVVKECGIPISKISKMDLHNGINTEPHEHHAFYALDVKYKNGQAQIYIADDGCGACVVASDFEENKKEVTK